MDSVGEMTDHIVPDHGSILGLKIKIVCSLRTSKYGVQPRTSRATH